MTFDETVFKLTLQNLTDNAARLREAADALAAPINSINESLRAFNLGVQAQVQIQPDKKWFIGYGRIADAWGIALSDGETTWPFNEAPAYLRIAGTDKLYELIVEIRAQVERSTVEVTAAVVRAKDLISGLK